MLFNFQLYPLNDIAPFGKPPDLSLSWFGLTDGWYWIDVGSAELFRYTPEIIEYSHQITPSPQPPSSLDLYPDYYVVRLWEDIMEMLPSVLEPLPMQLVALLVPQVNWDTWHEHFFEKWWQEDEEVEVEVTDLYEDAIRWWHERRLSTSHLRGSCNIHFWTDGEDLFIDWNNRGQEQEIEGIPVWAATWGRISMSLQDFIDELTSFDQRLITAMASRVEQVKAGWPRPDIFIDLDGLQKEQSERAGWLAEAFKHAQEHPPINWEHILELLRQVEKR